MTAHDRPPGPEGDPIAETIARVSRSAVVVCDKCRLHGANNDVTVCRAPGNCHDLADHSRAATLLAAECERLRERVARLEEALRPLATASLGSSVRPVYVIGARFGAPYDQRAAEAMVQAARAALEGSK